MKNIVFCADGTWDSSANQTNVYSLFRACVTNATQIPFYDDGVGSDGTPIEKLLGGAMGVGLFQKIKDGYAKIAHVYEANDAVFIFGFSRGAYTARSLAGMIAVSGLPTKNFTDDVVETAFQAYRTKDPAQRSQILGRLSNCDIFDARITMVGVWDTVGSLGIPSIVGAVDPLLYGFLDTSLHPDVLRACQALAIDERRAEFPPTLWDPNSLQPGRVLEQVWFSGVHCDVGGGYPAHGLSDITLAWMLNRAVAAGLKVDPSVACQYPFPFDGKHSLDDIHESWNLVWGFPKRRTVAGNSSISNSAQIRCTHAAGYRPQNLSYVGSSDQLANTYALVGAVANPDAAAAAPVVTTTSPGAGLSSPVNLVFNSASAVPDPSSLVSTSS